MLDFLIACDFKKGFQPSPLLNFFIRVFFFFITITTSNATCPVLVNSDFSKFSTITIDESMVSGSTDLTDFPLLINIESNDDLRSTAYAGLVTQSEGYDIVFYGSTTDGAIAWEHEIEVYDETTGKLVVWVKVPTLYASSNTEFYMYYGNADINSQCNTVASVWTNDFNGVWHLNETPGSGMIKDATGNAENGTSYNMNADNVLTSGVIGNSMVFNYDIDTQTATDENQYIRIPDTGASTSLEPTALTISAWFKTLDTENQDAWAKVFSKGRRERPYSSYTLEFRNDASSGKVGFQTGRNRTDLTSYIYGGQGFVLTETASDAITEDKWYFITGVFDGVDTQRFYVDGTLVATVNTSGQDTDYDSPIDFYNIDGGSESRQGSQCYPDMNDDSGDSSGGAGEPCSTDGSNDNNNRPFIRSDGDGNLASGFDLGIGALALNENSSGYADNNGGLNFFSGIVDELRISNTARGEAWIQSMYFSINNSSSYISVNDAIIVAPLPIELAYFNVSERNNRIHIYWETETELNVDYFEVQRSRDGFSFETIEVVEASGYSSVKQFYEIFDEKAQSSSQLYYRLKSVDNDKTYSFSQSKAIKRQIALADEVVLSPNPASNYFSINLPDDMEGNVIVEMITVSGEVVIKQSVDSSSSRKIPLNNTSKGVYLVRVYNNDLYISKKLIVR